VIAGSHLILTTFDPIGPYRPPPARRHPTRSALITAPNASTVCAPRVALIANAMAVPVHFAHVAARIDLLRPD